TVLFSFSVFFFFYCSGDLRDLHSFPTRRSSDLPSTAPRDGFTIGIRIFAQINRTCNIWLLSSSSGRQRARTGGSTARNLAHNLRSEEHTSELQSPCNLVCRLLLEKKNKNHILNT